MRYEKSGAKLRLVAFAGGGSGGHSYPLLAIAAELKRRAPDTGVYFISTPPSVERRILEKSGLPFHLIPSGKLNAQSPFTMLATLVKLPLAFLKSAWIVLRERPQLVVSAGGYAGAPFLATAALLGVPCAVYEQNRKPGLANRWMAKFVRAVFVNFPATADYFPGKKVIPVGLPFRREILGARWEENAWPAELARDPFRIFVFGGSQGALAVNRLVVEAAKELRDLWPRLFIHHQTGQNDLATVEAGYRELGFTNVKVEPYVHDMAGAYRSAHLVICRAGASSIVELAAARKAAILIPLVSKDNHQAPNADELVRNGAAVLLVQTDATGRKLADLVRGFFQDREKIRRLGTAIGAMSREDAEARIIAAMEGLVAGE